MQTVSLLSWLLAWNPLVQCLLQLLLLFATVGLIVVGRRQADAAKKQALAAVEQIAASKAQQKELLSQGIAARRPFFVVFDSGANQAAMKNVGVGIAFKTSWRFIQQDGFAGLVEIEEMGAIAVGDAKPMSFVALGKREIASLEDLGRQGGIRVEYEDSSKKRYFSVITRAPEGHTNVIETDEM